MRPLNPSIGYIALLLGGCGAAVPTPSAGVAVAKPGHVRVVNDTTHPLTVRVGKLYTIVDISPGSMSYAMPVGAKRPIEITVKADAKSSKVNAMVEPGKFTTVYVSRKGVKAFQSGDSLSDPHVGRIDFVNLTSAVATFRFNDEQVNVEPLSSSTRSSSNSIAEIGLGSEKTQIDNIAPAQIWAAFAINSGNRTILKSQSLKGTGGALGTGGPPAN